jgi:hypothetical protein
MDVRVFRMVFRGKMPALQQQPLYLTNRQPSVAAIGLYPRSVIAVGVAATMNHRHDE